jgi:hypothetical protein
MFRPRGQGVLERDDDPFASAVESWIFPVSQSAGFDFSALDGHQPTLSGLHGALLGSPHPGNVTEGGSTSAFADITVQPLEAGALTFTLHNVGGVTPGSQAEAGFLRATALWQSFLGDTVNIRLDVGFSSLGPSILGSTGSSGKVVSYAAVRAALNADQSSSDDAAAVASLSAGSSLAFFTNNAAGTQVFDNDGSVNNTYLFVTTADLKALGIVTDANGQPVDTGAADGSIRFSSDFTWDFDPGDGINAGAIDFVGVAFHEIGHALGFVSGVDTVDYYSGSGPGGRTNLNPYAIFSTLDLFRYSGNGVRDLSYGGTKYFSLNGGATNLALFSTGDFQGDGNQASHWKDGLGIGIMDPTSVPTGQANVITSRDIQAMDVIGWNLASNQSSASVSIGDLQISEGNNGTKVAAFTVSRSGSTAAFSVNFATSDGGATTADNDYVANAGTLNFGAGVNTQTISVIINGDTKFEPDETFFVNLSGTTNGATISDSQGIGTIQNDELLNRAAGDFNADGTSDVFWRNDSSGHVGTWEMHNNVQTWHDLGGSGVDHKVAGVGDFNSDSTSDVLWRNDANGHVGIWEMHDNVQTWHDLGGSGVDHKVAGVGDFNNDGTSDVLWRNDSSGHVGTWEMHDNVQTWRDLGGSGLDHKVVGIGDFNNDGTADVFWRNDSNGHVGIWEMHDNVQTSHDLGGSGVDHKVVGIGDFNADGTADVLWRNDASGHVGIWEMHDNVQTWHDLGGSGTDFKVAGIGDYNGDGTSDIFWRNDSSGHVGIWEMHNNVQTWHDLGLSSGVDHSFIV